MIPYKYRYTLYRIGGTTTGPARSIDEAKRIASSSASNGDSLLIYGANGPQFPVDAWRVDNGTWLHMGQHSIYVVMSGNTYHIEEKPNGDVFWRRMNALVA